MTIRIALVDDYRPFRQALREKLAQDPDFDVVWEASTGSEALSIAGKLPPDVMLLDISLADMSGIEVMKHLVAGRVFTKVVALSTYTDKHFVLEMLKAGASGYVCKIDVGEVSAAIHEIARGGKYLSRELGSILGK